jgi:hypothetical protein
MTNQLARRPYNRRPPPSTFDPGWESTELAHVAQAIQPITTRRVIANTTIDVMDDVILCDCTAGPISVTLLDPSRVQWMMVTVKKIDASANQVTIVGTVDGLVNPTSHARWNVVTVMSDGTQWFVRSVGSDTSSGASASSTAQRTSTVTNATTTPVSAGLVIPVTAGGSYRIQYDVLITNTHVFNNPMALTVSYPGASVIAAVVNSFTTNASTSAMLTFIGSGSPMSLGSWVNFATSSPVMATIHLIIRNASAGNVDLLFACAAGAANTITISDGSCAVAQGL